MSDDSNRGSGLIYFLAGAGLTYVAVCWQRSREHAERKARFAAGEGFQAPPPQLTMHRPPPQRLYAQPAPSQTHQQPLQQQRPQFPPPPQPEPRVQNMLPQNPQVAPFSVPTPPPMQYNPPPPPTPQPPSQHQDGEGSSLGGEQF